MTKEELIIEKLIEAYRKINILNRLDEKDITKNYTPSEAHCIELIGKIQDANVTKLAEAFKMTRGAISKITKKLLRNGAIISYQKPENKKEVYFSLTELGETIFAENEEMHTRWKNRDIEAIKQSTEQEKDAVINLLNKLIDNIDGKLHS